METIICFERGIHMKKVISILLVLGLVLSFTACGNSSVKDVEKAIDKITEASKEEKATAVKAAEEAYNALSDKQKENVKNNDVLKKAMIFVLASEAYDNVEIAYNITEQFGSDVYEAWRLGIYDDDEILDDGVKYLAKELSLSESELADGVAYTIIVEILNQDWENASKEDKDKYRKDTDVVFYMFKDSLFSFCVRVVSNAYKANGKTDIVQTALDKAKADMKEMSEKYSDYEHYSSLKGYYTTTNAFFEFCLEPKGSFNQVVDTINGYRNDARNFRNDLAYIFSD